MRYLLNGNFKKYCVLFKIELRKQACICSQNREENNHKLFSEVKSLVQMRGFYLVNVLTARYYRMCHFLSVCHVLSTMVSTVYVLLCCILFISNNNL